MLDCRNVKNLVVFLNLAEKALESFPDYKDLLKLVKKARKTPINAQEARTMKSIFEKLQKDNSLKEFKNSKDAKLKHFKLIIKEIVSRLQ